MFPKSLDLLVPGNFPIHSSWVVVILCTGSLTSPNVNGLMFSLGWDFFLS